MAANFDWNCLAHGHFEGPIGKCPHGCGQGMVEKVWLSFPGTKSNKTKSTDKMAQGLMDRYGMTDMRPTAGKPAMQEPYRWNQKEVVARTAPYSVPVNEKLDVFQQGAALGAVPEESSTINQMKREGRMEMKVNVIGDDKVTVTAKDIESAHT